MLKYLALLGALMLPMSGQIINGGGSGGGGGGTITTINGTANQVSATTPDAGITYNLALTTNTVLPGQSANGTDVLSASRFTDTTPTGNFLRFKTAALADLMVLDVLGNMSATSYSTTNAGGVAGYVTLGQGTAVGLGTTAVRLTVPTGVTSYNIVWPAAAASGPILYTNTANIVTGAFGSLTGNTTKLATWTGATTGTKCVDTDASGNLQVTANDCGVGTISGLTNNVLTKATSSTSIGNSSITDNGTTVSTTEPVITTSYLQTGASPPSSTNCGAGTAGAYCPGEGTAPTGTASADILYADSTAHRFKMINNNAAAVQVLGTGDVPTAQYCGTTTTCSHTAETSSQIVYGSAPLVSGTPSTYTVTGISPAFTSSSSYVCTIAGTTGATTSLYSVANVSGSSFTVTGPATDTNTVNFICVGI